MLPVRIPGNARSYGLVMLLAAGVVAGSAVIGSTAPAAAQVSNLTELRATFATDVPIDVKADITLTDCNGDDDFGRPAAVSVAPSRRPIHPGRPYPPVGHRRRDRLVAVPRAGRTTLPRLPGLPISCTLPSWIRRGMEIGLGTMGEELKFLGPWLTGNDPGYLGLVPTASRFLESRRS
jgi:hypothetical protein